MIFKYCTSFAFLVYYSTTDSRDDSYCMRLCNLMFVGGRAYDVRRGASLTVPLRGLSPPVSFGQMFGASV
jgi:hypothetical protein